MVKTYEEYIRLLDNELAANNYNMLGAFEIDDFVTKHHLYSNLQLLNIDVMKDAEILIN